MSDVKVKAISFIQKPDITPLDQCNPVPYNDWTRRGSGSESEEKKQNSDNVQVAMDKKIDIKQDLSDLENNMDKFVENTVKINY